MSYKVGPALIAHVAVFAIGLVVVGMGVARVLLTLFDALFFE